MIAMIYIMMALKLYDLRKIALRFMISKITQKKNHWVSPILKFNAIGLKILRSLLKMIALTLQNQ